MSSPFLFDRSLLRLRRKRATPRFTAHDFLFRELNLRLLERLNDFSRTFPLALNLGAGNGLLEALPQHKPRIGTLIHSATALSPTHATRWIVADEEWLPFAENTFDLIVSAALHSVNDLPGTFTQIQRALKPDGLFLAILPGGESLKELRQSMEEAELQHTGGISPRVHPFIDVQTAGSLLQRAGLALPVIDSETLTVSYPHPLALLHDLRGMGETNILLQRSKTPLTRTVLFNAMERYMEHYADAEGRVPATFELVTLTAWKPHASQQQPLKRGSGQVHFSEVLKK